MKLNIKKTIIPILLIICCCTIGTRLIKADKQSLQNFSTDFFIKNAIHQYQDCEIVSKNDKTFINYDLLWAELDENWNYEFYVIWNWQWYYIDERGNLNLKCAFYWLPITITLAENKNWYYIEKYQSADSRKSNIQSVKNIFSDNAFMNRYSRKNRKNQEKISFLNDAENFFWIKLNDNKNFDCKFCDKKRYYYESILNKNWEKRDLYWIKDLWEKYYLFSSDGTLTKWWNDKWNDKWNYSRNFSKNNSTIIIEDKNDDSIIERFIIDEITDNELVSFSEYIQIKNH